MRWVLAVVALGGCKGWAEKQCDPFLDVAERCMTLNGDTLDELEMYCIGSLTQERSPGSVAQDMFEAMDECSRATTCEALDACFAKHGCNLVFTHPGDTSGQLACYGKKR